MKKLMIMAAFMVAAVTANAQGAVGSITIQPKIGMNLATITNCKLGDRDSKTLVGLVGGAEAEYVLADKVSIAAAALYSKQGCAFDISGLDYYHYSLDYINIPIVANYYIVPGLAIKAGIQPGFLLGANRKVKWNGGSEESDMKNVLNTFDLSVPLGASYEYKNFVLDVRYNLDVLKLNKEGESSSHNSVIQFTLGYKLPIK